MVLNINEKRKIRDYIKLIFAIIVSFLYFPHLLIYFLSKNRTLILSDILALKSKLNISLSNGAAVLYFLHNNSYYRSVFYYRIGPVLSLLVGWWRPGNRYFIIPDSTKIAEGLMFAHPYSTILNAESIGKNFSCIHCVTIGKKDGKRPIIGDNVTVGCNVCIIGGISIGNNVIIGAGSIVVKDVPNNCVVAGNPAKIIRML